MTINSFGPEASSGARAVPKPPQTFTRFIKEHEIETANKETLKLELVRLLQERELARGDGNLLHDSSEEAELISNPERVKYAIEIIFKLLELVQKEIGEIRRENMWRDGGDKAKALESERMQLEAIFDQTVLPFAVKPEEIFGNLDNPHSVFKETEVEVSKSGNWLEIVEYAKYHNNFFRNVEAAVKFITLANKTVKFIFPSFMSYLESVCHERSQKGLPIDSLKGKHMVSFKVETNWYIRVIDFDNLAKGFEYGK